MTEGIHHFHKRKRKYQKHEPYPHSDKRIRMMDMAIYIVGIAGPIMTIPQLMKIWVEKNASGVSPVSWGAYLLFAVFWLMYGIVHREKPIILTYIGWIIADALIVIGVIIYG